MNDILTHQQWNELRIYLKQKYPELKDADLPYYEAEEQDMFYMIDCVLQRYEETPTPANHNFSHTHD